jgi:hypothetical protein
MTRISILATLLVALVALPAEARVHPVKGAVLVRRPQPGASAMAQFRPDAASDTAQLWPCEVLAAARDAS